MKPIIKSGLNVFIVVLMFFSCLNAFSQTGCGNNQNGGTTPPPPPNPPSGPPDPINAFTADEYRVIRDLQVWGSVGQAPLEWTRYAHSRVTPGQEWFGDGHHWRHSYQWEMADWGGTPAQINLNYPDGSAYLFTQVSSTQWNGPVGCTDILYENGKDFYLQRQNGFVYHFTRTTSNGNNTYLMTDFCDSIGNSTTLAYDSSNRLTTVTEPGGRTLTVHYANYNVTVRATGLLSFITSTPVPNQWNEIDLTWNPGTARYLTYTGPTNGYCDIAELQYIDTNGQVIAGTPLGTGPAGSLDTDYTKAFDGNTSTYADMADATGGFVGLDLGANNTAVVAKIRFYPRSGYESRMAPTDNSFGAFGISSIFPAVTTVISEVDSSDGRSVVYNYGAYNDSTLPYNYEVLNSVSYDDGTQATYTYSQIFPSTQPMITAFDDPRFIAGPLFKSRTVYYKESVFGAVQYQEGYDTGDIVTTIGIKNNDIEMPTATYGNGGVDTFCYSNGFVPYGMEYAHIDTLGRTTSYTYDANGFLATETDPLNHTTTTSNSVYGNPLQITHPDGTTRTWTRDSRDLPLTMTDERGHTKTWTRDAFHRITRIDYPDGGYETFTYNSFGEVLTHRLRNGGSESFSYGTTGLMTSKTDAVGQTWNYTYDSHDLLASVTDPNNHTTSYIYNLQGLVTQITYPDSSTTTYTYNAYGKKTGETNEIGKTISYTCDQYQRLNSVTDPLGRVTQTVYRNTDYMKYPSKLILPSGKTTVFTYDTEWNELSKTNGYSTSDAATTNYVYDNANRLDSVTDPRGKTTSFTYDSRNRKLTSTDPLSHTASYTYDGTNNVLTITRPDSGVTTNTYDSLNRLLTSTDPKGETTIDTYDTSGNLLTTTDAKGNTYSFGYDTLNRRTSLTYPDSTVESYTYDPAGNLQTYTTRAGQVKTLVYDNRNRVTSYTWSDGTPGVSYTYDAAGRLLTLSNSVSTLTYTYDDANQQLTETQNVNGSAGPMTLTYSYNLDSKRVGILYPGGKSLAYSYTNRNQIASIQDTIAGSNVALYQYDTSGNRISKTLANGVTTTSTYDDANRLLLLQSTEGTTTIARFDYGYDSVNRRTSEQRDQTTTDNYTYDAVDQVTGVNYGLTTATNSVPTRTVAYVYDAVGNRTSVTDNGATTSYSASVTNEYTTEGGTALTSDANGNLTGRKGWGYTYDAQNRLTGASNGATIATFAYDPRNRIVQRIISGTTTQYLVYDGWSLIEERGITDAVLTTYVHGAAIDEMLSKTDATSGTVYYLHNGLGSVTHLTNAVGAILEKYTYDVYGTPTITDGSGNPLSATAYNNRFLFTGREYIAALNLYDFRNRFYSPELGRFLQTDPLRFDAKDINIYRYCHNNPVNLKDANGEFIFVFIAIGLAAWGGYEAGGALYNFFSSVQNSMDTNEQVAQARADMIENQTQASADNYQQALQQGVNDVNNAANAGANLPGTGMQGPPDTPSDSPADAAANLINRAEKAINDNNDTTNSGDNSGSNNNLNPNDNGILGPDDDDECFSNW